MSTRQVQPELLARVESLGSLAQGWDGADAPSPAPGLPAARTFIEGLGRVGSLPSVGPANEGGIVFEWDLPHGVSVYCYARETGVEISAFNDTKDLVELTASPAQAAEVVRALLTVFQSVPVGATR